MEEKSKRSSENLFSDDLLYMSFNLIKSQKL